MNSLILDSLAALNFVMNLYGLSLHDSMKIIEAMKASLEVLV